MISQRIFEIWIIFIVFYFHVNGYNLSPESRTWVGCISHHEAQTLINHFNRKAINAIASIDLGLSTRPVYFNDNGVSISVNNDPADLRLVASWDELQQIIKKKPSGCYALYDDGSKPFKISTISSKTNIPASLCPPLERSGAPTMVSPNPPCQ
jgi:hypothetical protein